MVNAAGLVASYGHIHANQESWPWWFDAPEVVSEGIKVVHSLSVGNV